MKVFTRGEEKQAKEMAQKIVKIGNTIDIKILSKIKVGSKVLNRELDYLNREREHSLSDFPGWKICFIPKEEVENLSAGEFFLIYSEEEKSFSISLKKYSEEIPKIFLKEHEINIQKFPQAIIGGMRNILKEFNEEFDKEVKESPPIGENALAIAIEEAEKRIPLERFRLRFERRKLLVFPKWEPIVLSQEAMEELK